jgi:hypothetical protein
VVPPVVLGQHVVAEVVRRVAPRRVDVVAVPLGVVVLDEQLRPLDPEVVPLPRFGAARPGEAEVVQPGLLELVHLSPGHLVGQPPRERPDQDGQVIELDPVQRGTGNALRAPADVAEDVALLLADHVVRLRAEHRVRPLHLADPGHHPGGEIRRRPVVDDRGLPLRRVERVHEPEAEFLVVGQRSQQRVGRGLGAQHARRGRHPLAAGHGEVE